MKLELRETNTLITKKEKNLAVMIFKIFTVKLKVKRELRITLISTLEVRMETLPITLRLEDLSELTNDQKPIKMINL